jgi:ADP-ribose pyrophosphatase YjhB (NUDIX family)
MESQKKHFTASALIVHENKILLLNHLKLGVWLYPGGHIEDNETPDQTVIREVKEETGLKVEIISQKDDSLSNLEADVSSLHIPYAILCELVGDHYHNDLIYLCRIKDGNIKELKHRIDESSGARFFSEEELDAIKLFPNFKKLLKKTFNEVNAS